MRSELDQALRCIRSRSTLKTEIGIILGSGLGILADRVEQPLKITAAEIPHYPLSTVPGHAGNLVFGKLAGIPVLLVQGRTHYYEGYPFDKITFAVRILAGLGIKLLIVCSAAGAVNTSFKPGDLMLVTDHINLMLSKFLTRPSDYGDRGRFQNLSEPYSSRYFKTVDRVARTEKIKLRRGVLGGMVGPCYETASEVRMLARLGADAVSMSMVPEVLAALMSGLEVIGLACITNMATGTGGRRLSHTEVIRVADKVKEKVFKLIKGIIQGVNK
jgi:purine-nucleoside phosphorylase